MKKIIASLFIMQLIFCFSTHSAAVPKTKYLRVSVDVHQKCNVSSPEAFDYDAFSGITVDCTVDTPYIKIDEINAYENIEKDLYDNFTEEFYPQLYIENEVCKTWCNAATTIFPPEESNGDIIKMTVLW